MSEFIPCVRAPRIYSDFSFVSKHFLNSAFFFENVNRGCLYVRQRENEEKEEEGLKKLEICLAKKKSAKDEEDTEFFLFFCSQKEVCSGSNC